MKKTFVPTVVTALTLLFQSHPVYSAPSAKAKENLKLLVESRSCRNCDLREINFNRLDLAGVDLEGADLSQSKFFLTNLSRANLRNTRLLGSEFGGADLGDADLTGADLRGVMLDTAYTAGAKMSGKIIATKPFEKIGVDDVEKNVYVADQAVPKKAPVYTQAEVGKLKSTSSSASKKQQPSPAVFPDVVAAPVKKVAVPPAEIAVPAAPPAKKSSSFGAVVVPAQVVEKKVDNTDKAAPVKELALLDNVQVQGAETKDASPVQEPSIDQVKLDNWAKLLDKKRCYGCNLSGLDLSHENLKGADLEKADLSGCNLEKANLKRANLKGALLVGVNLKGANLSKADLYRADLTNADLSGSKREDISLDGAVTEGVVGLDSGLMLLDSEKR